MQDQWKCMLFNDLLLFLHSYITVRSHSCSCCCRRQHSSTLPLIGHCHPTPMPPVVRWPQGWSVQSWVCLLSLTSIVPLPCLVQHLSLCSFYCTAAFSLHLSYSGFHYSTECWETRLDTWSIMCLYTCPCHVFESLERHVRSMWSRHIS